ncbi:MAG TPA: hypothetical protein VF269_05690 [Rhodanobacteraceae bacterium]
MSELGVVVALPGEAACLPARKRSSGHFRLTVAGMGAWRATQAAEGLIAGGAGALLSWGVVGGLSPALHPGDLVLVDRVMSAESEETCDPAWRDQLAQTFARAGVSMVTGQLWCHPRAVTSVQDKCRLAASGCLVVDMESAAVARVARAAGVPFIAIKSVCDPADRAIPDDVAGLLREDGRVRLPAVARAMLRGPVMWRSLRRMQRDFDAACAGLRRAGSVLPLSCPA